MASPQLESGYIRIANEIWDEVISRKLTERQQKILKLILRLSYGCQKKMAIIPRLGDFELVGVRIQDAKKEITYLCQCKVVEWDGKETYALNKNYEEWRINVVKGWDEEKFNNLLSQNIGSEKDRKVTKSVTKSNLPTENTYEKCKSEVPQSVIQDEKSYEMCKLEVTKSVSQSGSSDEKSYEKCNSGLTKSVTSELRKVEVSNAENPSGSKAGDLPKDSIKDSIKKRFKNSSSCNSIHPSDNDFAKAYQVIERNFGLVMNPVQIDKLEGYLSAGLEPEVVEQAVLITREAGKDIRYLWSILDSCEQTGTHTEKAFEERQARWKEEQNAKHTRGNKGAQSRGHPEKGEKTKSKFAFLDERGRE